MRLVRILALAFVVVLAACGSSGSKTASTGTTTASSSATTAAAASGVALLAQCQGPIQGHQGGLPFRFAQRLFGLLLFHFQGFGETLGQLALTAALTVVKRPDGTQQVAANGQPLYRYAGDAKTGDTNGQGVGGVWFALMASGSSVGGGAGAAPATTKATTATTAASSGGMGGGY